MKWKFLIIYIFIVLGTSWPENRHELRSQENQFNPVKKEIIKQLYGFISDSLVVVGQHCENSKATAKGYEKYVEGLYDSTGKYPALIGLEYGYEANADFDLINSYAVDFWEKGGWVTIGWHADNPWKEGYNCRWNSVENKDSIHLSQLVKSAPDSEAKTNYRAELSNVANALKKLNDAGVIVFWRPFHEMNGSWFWWGANDIKNPNNDKDYVLLWRDMYETFTIDYGLDNLIWAYTPFAVNNWTAGIIPFYPGDNYVDIVGVDIYSNKPNFDDYEELKKFNKPIIAGEVGPLNESYGKYNQLELLQEMRGRAAFFLQWSSWGNAKVAIVDNPYHVEMMNHQHAVTLEKLALTNQRILAK